MRKLYATLALLGAFASAGSALAQSNFFEQYLTTSSDFILSIDPAYPAPNQTVQVTLSSNLSDLSQSTIVWQVNGRTLEGAAGTEISVNTGALGSETTVAASITGTMSGEVSTTITPTQVDLLYDADTYTPPFYTGRALPSTGSLIRLAAIPHFTTVKGAVIPTNSISFTWKRNGRVLANISGKGKDTATLTAPVLYGRDLIEVEAQSLDGTRQGSASVTIPSIQPIVLLYQDNPLGGIDYHHAVRTHASISDSEVAFAAAPFFAHVRSPNDAALSYSWKVNGISIPATTTSASEVTINADNSDGTADLSVEITHASNILFDATGLWHLSFSPRSTGGAALFPQSQ